MTFPYLYPRPVGCAIGATSSTAATNPMTHGVASRIYLIRLAMGDGHTPLSIRRFAEVVSQRSGRHYGNTTICRLETGKQAAALVDVVAIASVDPKARGAAWLSFGDGGAR
jgi:hypothetical protein